MFAGNDQLRFFPSIVHVHDEVSVLCLFSSKGGVGCSVSAAALGLLSAGSQPTLLVDLRGEVDAILGVPQATDGLSDWFSLDEPSPDILQRLEIPVTSGLALLPRGSCRSPARPDRYRLLSRLLSSDGRRVIVDIGNHAVPAVPLIAESSSSVLVTRACFLAVEAARLGPSPDRVLLIEEEGRAMGPKEVAARLGAEVAVRLRWHRDVARAVDSGLLASGVPKPMRSLGGLL